MLQNGEILSGMYQVIRELGTGGTGIVYLGYHMRLQKQIVIKKIKENVAGRVNVRAEADILKKLHHTYLPQVYDFFESYNGIYTVMDYIPGQDLQYYLDHNYTFPEQTLCLWLNQMCDVLEYLHSRDPQILHSDIKPGNIMITPEGNICLIDFNISLDGEAVTEIQGLSRHYAAPEQFQCAMDKLYGRKNHIKVDERMDIYSTGAVFYRLMTGYMPDAETGIPSSILSLDIPYNEGMKVIVDKAVRRDVRQRFQSAAQMRQALEKMKKLSPRYKRLNVLEILSGSGWGIMFLLGILLIYKGTGIYQKECWEKFYEQFYIAAEQQNNSEILKQGMDMLNDHAVGNYLKKHPEEKAKILHTIGDTYYQQEQYADAVEYYEEALKENGQESGYLRDYMMALARDGQYVNIELLQEEYPQINIEETETIFVEAEAAYSQGDETLALSKCKEAAEKSGDSELKSRIYELEAEIYAGQNEVERAAQAAVKAAENDPSVNILRMAGAMTFTAGSQTENADKKSKWYQKALEYYEILCRKSNVSYEDQLNEAITMRALGKYADSIYVLKQMEESYPEDYKIRMWICYDYVDMASVKGYSSVSSELKFAYSSCKYLYQKSGEQDDNMESLISLMNQYK